MKKLSKNKEIWKDVPGFEGRYKASNTGKILSIKHGKKTILNPDKTTGYPRLHFLVDGKSKKYLVHRVVATSFGLLKSLNEKKALNHIDGNKLNANINNLEIATQSENIKHAFQIGLCKPLIGEMNPFSKYKVTDVKKIIKLRKKGLTRTQIVEELKIPLHFVKDIIYNRSWLHVKR